MKNTGTLHLLPMPLGEDWKSVMSPRALQLMNELDFFVAENVKTARRFITQFRDVHPLTFETMNKHTEDQEVQKWIKVLQNGKSMGYMSEAGLPCLADPGTRLVRQAHRRGIDVETVPGASAIVMALVGSGLNGQKFRFNGYLSPKSHLREKELKQLEQDARQFKQTEIFMETPYRNEQMIKSAFKVLQEHTHFTIAANLTQSSAYHRTHTIRDWEGAERPDLHKIPAVFCLAI